MDRGHALGRRRGTTLRHGSMEGRLLVIRSSGQELQVGNEGSFYGSHTYLRHRTEVLEPAIYGRYELETGDRHADRNRQRGTDHLHASGTDGQHADRRDNDLRTPGPRHMPFRPSREWRPGAYQAAERDARAPTRTHNSRAHEFKTHSTRFTEHGSQSTGHGS